MKLSIPQIRLQFKRAEKLGWLPYFEEAVGAYTHGIFDAADLMAIASRETNLDPKWLKKPGDGGNGFGLMQADRRSFPEFTKGNNWKDARLGILFGAKVLVDKWFDYRNNLSKSLTVTSSKTGKRSSYTNKVASGETAQKIVISSYNCGRWAQYAYAKGQDIDKYSTGGDYAADVMARAVELRKLLKDQTSSAAATSGGGKPGSPTEVPNASILPPGAGESLSTEQPPIAQGQDSLTIPSPPQGAVMVEREERVEVKEGFFKKLWLKIIGATTALGGVDAITDKAQQAQTLGLPQSFWTRLFYVLVALAVLWFIYELWKEVIGPSITNLRRWLMTRALVAANKGAAAVTLVSREDVDKYEAAGWTVARRGR